MLITFRVPGLPVAQPRQRHKAVFTGGRVATVNYTPRKHPVQAYKAAIQLAFRIEHRGPPLQGPIGLQLVFVFPRPKSLSGPEVMYHCKRPDIDNCEKGIMDSLRGLAYKDDAQVCRKRSTKYIAGDEEPHTMVTIEELKGEVDIWPNGQVPQLRS